MGRTESAPTRLRRRVKQTRLVEEEDDGRPHEPPRVADRVEEDEGLLHSVDRLCRAKGRSTRILEYSRDRGRLTILVEHLVVFGNGDEEDDGRNVLEAVDPLFALRALSSNIEHAVLELSNLKVGLGDTGRLDTRAKNVCSANGSALIVSGER